MRAVTLFMLLIIAGCATTRHSTVTTELGNFTIDGQIFSKSDILDAVVSFDATGMPLVGITLSPSGQARFTALTVANVGKRLPIKLGDRTLSEPLVTEPIYGNQMQITRGMTVRDAQQLAREISGKSPTNQQH